MATAVAKASVAIIDGSDPKPPVAGFKPTPKALKEGDVLTLSGFSKNLEPGTTLYWNLNPRTSNATLKDFKILVPKPRGFSTTIAKDGSFEIVLPTLQDKTKEKNEQFQVELFQTPTARQALAARGDHSDRCRAKTSRKMIPKMVRKRPSEGSENDPKDTSEDRPGLTIESHVIPARFSDKRIPIKTLIDFSGRTKINF